MPRTQSRAFAGPDDHAADRDGGPHAARGLAVDAQSPRKFRGSRRTRSPTFVSRSPTPAEPRSRPIRRSPRPRRLRRRRRRGSSGLTPFPSAFAAVSHGRRMASVRMGSAVSGRCDRDLQGRARTPWPTEGLPVSGLTKPTRSRHHCPRLVRIGDFTRADRAGSNPFCFTGRVGSRELASGRCLLFAIARTSGQNAFAAKLGGESQGACPRVTTATCERSPSC
jgi:hypothetical protein